MERTIRIIVVRDGDVYVAQALEVDIAAQGRTPEEASKRLSVAMRAEADEARAAGGSLFDIGPAPEAFHVMYAGDAVISREEKLVA